MRSFYNFFVENTDESIPGFSENWRNALSQSEELSTAIELMKKVSRLFPTKEIYIVGGVPRDLIIGNEIDDVDMATNIPFEELAKHFQIRNISKNDSQPVYTILYGNYNYDLAKFREDSQVEMGRQNNVSTEIDDFQTDTKRRDITINSFGLDGDGKIVDYQGGLKDLQDKIIRSVGDAKERFMEDATRILRIFRFAAKMNFSIEDYTLQCAKELKHILQNPDMISQESIAQEFYKAAKSGPTLSRFLKSLQDAGILHDILPEFTQMEGYMHNPKHHPEGGSSVLGHVYECLNVSPFTDPIVNLGVLFHDFGKATTRGEKNGHSTYYGHEDAGVPIVENIFKRLKFNNLGADDKRNILMAVARHMMIHKIDELNNKSLRKLIFDPSWKIVRSVAYCDAASRGPGKFNAEEYERKIIDAENKLAVVPGGGEELKKTIAQYINGNILMDWFPVMKTDKSQFRDVLGKLQDYVADEILAGREPNIQLITKKAKEYYVPTKNESFLSFIKKSSVINEYRHNLADGSPAPSIQVRNSKDPNSMGKKMMHTVGPYKPKDALMHRPGMVFMDQRLFNLLDEYGLEFKPGETSKIKNSPMAIQMSMNPTTNQAIGKIIQLR